MHTTHSDGVCSPCEVVVAAAGVGLAALAITDHDTVSALPIARPEADRLGVELVAGVELTCDLDGRELHLLGHFFRDDDADLLAAMSSLRAGRTRRLELMVERLAREGLAVDPDALRRAFPRAVLGRRHLAEFWRGPARSPACARRSPASSATAGPAAWPSPASTSSRRSAWSAGRGASPPWPIRPMTSAPRPCAGLPRRGMGAIEVDGPGISNRLARRFRDWAAQLALVPIAGSDFHAPDRPGRWVGAIATPQADLDRLRLVRRNR